jgi:carbamoyltransferase
MRSSNNSMPKKSYFLGFMSYCSHDPSAAMVELVNTDGIISCQLVHFEEGMLSRKKKSYHFPTRSIAACLDYFDIELHQVNQVVTDFMDRKSFVDTSLNYRHLIGDYIRQNLNLSPEQIVNPINHHEAHAMSAWVGSGFEDAAFLAIDGLGSLQSTHTIFVTEAGKLRKVFSQTTPGIGSLYSLITELIGFKSGEEGKTMGLAPYGKGLKESKRFPLIDFKAKYHGLSVDYSEVINRSPDKWLIEDFGINNWPSDDLYNDFRAHLAYAVQVELEECLVYLAKEIRKVTGKSKICLSGGVALNCVANELLVKEGIFDEVYIFPDSADSGLSVGLAFQGVRNSLSDEQWSKVLNSHKFPKFSPDRSIPTIESNTFDGIPWEPVNLSYIVDQLELNSVIAVFYGGNEYGPRALGRRSFLANATNHNMKQILNEKIKHREAYRPFAPICLKEDFNKFFISDHTNHENMTYAVKATDFAKQKVPAVVHVDGTSRVQIATNDCGITYELLLEVKKRFGFGILINTSMNDNDEPIVFDQLDALSCFFRTGADILILNDKMLNKNKFELNNTLIKEIESDIEIKSRTRFQSAIQKIINKKQPSLELYLKEYLTVSNFYTKHASRIRLINIVAEIRSGSRRKFTRLLVSKRELDTLFNILSDNFYTTSDLSPTLLCIEDVFHSINLLEDGDFVLSYNLSNILRDHVESDLLKSRKIEIFYESSEFPIKRSTFMDSVDSELIDKILNSYENLTNLGINSAFDFIK